jgi:diguanylate cyclase (GGDEF)-like protein
VISFPYSDLSLVVPADFVCAGILLYTGIISLILGLQRRVAPLNLAFAATCLFSAALTLGLASYYLATTMTGAIEAMRWASAASILFVVSMLAFVALYTEVEDMAQVYAVGATVVLVFTAANFATPHGLRFSRVDSFSWLHLPWGESLFRVHGEVGAWNIGFRVFAVAVVAWGVWRLLAQFRRGRRRDALALAAYLLILLGVSIQGGAIDRGWSESFYYIPFALVGLALLMGVNLVMRLREQHAALEQTAARLQEENERRRDAESRIRERAFTDGLTGLPNRAFVQERIASQIELGAEGSHGAVLLCDLDHFKVINDALSHELGDEILKAVARRVAEVARAEATAARMDGNAFMLVLEDLHPDEAGVRARVEALAADVARALAQPIELGEHSIALSASTGLATFPARATTAAEVIGQADLALQRAKKRGRSNPQAFEPAFRRQAAERFQVVDGLRRALGTPELALHFQPQVALDGSLAGAEALLRWTSPSMGRVPPSTFIPIAEETGLIHALGEWSLRAGCECLAKWKEEKRPVGGHLSINVSPWQLARPEFVDRLADIVEASEVEPDRLTLEITESAILFDVAETVAKLRQIRSLGVRIALDDFGTGYSSLALLKDLPLDEIKIDQSFVRDIEDGANRHLVRVVVAIGAELGMQVVAEGVETPAARDALAALGCTCFQGYLFGRPMPQAAFEDWLRARESGRPLAQSLSV